MPQNQPVWSEPPKMISTKDHLYLKDECSWELIAMKKCAHFAAECTDPDIARAINEAGRMHQRHYEQLLKHMQTDNNAVLQQAEPAFSPIR